MKVITVHVSQEDIDLGICKSPTQCAIARAFHRMFDGVDVIVDNYSIKFRVGDKTFGHPLPEVADTFVELFDQRKDFVSPITFQLEMHDALYLELFGDEKLGKLVDDAACVPPTPIKGTVPASMQQV